MERDEVFTVRSDREYREVVDRILFLAEDYQLNMVELCGVLRLVELEVMGGVDSSE